MSSLTVLVMPHPTRIAPSDILATALRLFERDGQDGLTMRALARELGVSAPSLYFHVESREDLLRQLTREGLLDFGRVLGGAVAGEPDPARRIHLMADAYAAFAFEHPQLFVLLFGPCPEERLVEPAIGEQASAPLLETVAELAPAEDVLAISQALWSLAHGYATLAMAAQFRLGGEPRAAMHHAIDLLLAGLRVAGLAPTR
jgi:AcrR family transcriptional regulator